MDLSKLEALMTPLLEQEGAELVDLEYVREGSQWVLRVYIDKPPRISLDDCAYFSDRIGSLLDSSGILAAAYVLEVSSPGIDRVIKKEKDFQRFTGKAVKIQLKEPLEGRRNFSGVIRGCQGGQVAFECEGKTFSFEIGLIEEARLNETAHLSI